MFKRHFKKQPSRTPLLLYPVTFSPLWSSTHYFIPFSATLSLLITSCLHSSTFHSFILSLHSSTSPTSLFFIFFTCWTSTHPLLYSFAPEHSLFLYLSKTQILLTYTDNISHLPILHSFIPPALFYLHSSFIPAHFHPFFLPLFHSSTPSILHSISPHFSLLNSFTLFNHAPFSSHV